MFATFGWYQKRLPGADETMGPASMIVLIISAVVFSAVAILLARVLVKGTHNQAKGEPYECGVPTIGKSWIQYNVGYYLFALIFLIFDVELIFLFPWAVVARQLGWMALVEIVVFLFILFLGLLYAHRKGALRWV
jgi:NADH-quinone oxidoreductase subunit A